MRSTAAPDGMWRLATGYHADGSEAGAHRAHALSTYTEQQQQQQ